MTDELKFPDTPKPKSLAQFPPTDWPLIRVACGSGSVESRQALESLTCTYLPALYAYLRVAVGLGPQDADDLAVTLAADLPRFVGEMISRQGTPGLSFRNFLRRCAKNYALNWIEQERTLKRGGKAEPISLSEMEEPSSSSAVWQEAELSFDQEWAAAVVREAKAGLAAEYHRGNKTAEHDTYLPWLISDSPNGEHARLAASQGITEAYSRKKLERLREAFGEQVRATVRSTLSDPAELEAELRHLVCVWAATRAG